MSRGVAPGVTRRYYKRGEDNAWADGWSVTTPEGFFFFISVAILLALEAGVEWSGCCGNAMERMRMEKCFLARHRGTVLYSFECRSLGH